MSSLLDRVARSPALVRFRRRLRVKAAYKDVFGSPAGVVVLHDLARRAGMLEISFEPGDPHRTAWNDGRKSLLLDIFQELRWSEGELAQLAQLRDPEALGAEDDA